jgi:hypothetical protein
MDKELSRRRRVAVRRVLADKWDPIGVSDTPEAADEYDMYIGGVCELLDNHATLDQIAGYLEKIEVQRMGLTDLQGNPLVPKLHRDAAAAALKALDHFPAHGN